MMAGEWSDAEGPPPDGMAAPTLSTGEFEGPLDWLVEQARARRIDLRRLSVLALVETFEVALLEALDGRASASTIVRWGDWLVLAAELTLLRSRLMLPGAPDATTARDEAEALRRRLIARAEMAAGAGWLGRRVQLGIEVFERGGAESLRGAGRSRGADVTALLRACLVVLAVPEEAAGFGVAVPFWSMADAMGRMRRMLAEMGEEAVGLETFLPAVAPEASDRVRRCRAAVASTFVGSLELAREGAVTLTQGHGLGPIAARAATRRRA